MREKCIKLQASRHNSNIEQICLHIIALEPQTHWYSESLAADSYSACPVSSISSLGTLRYFDAKHTSPLPFFALWPSAALHRLPSFDTFSFFFSSSLHSIAFWGFIGPLVLAWQLLNCVNTSYGWCCCYICCCVQSYTSNWQKFLLPRTYCVAIFRHFA